MISPRRHRSCTCHGQTRPYDVRRLTDFPALDLEAFCVIDFFSPLRRTRAVVVLLAASALLIGAATALAANIQGDGTLVGSTGNDNINAGNGNDTIYGGGPQCDQRRLR